jgi:outer membrane immunogenic protein
MLRSRHGIRQPDRQLLLGVSLAALLAPASAMAEGLPRTVDDWRNARAWHGAYAGVHAGYGWGSADMSCDLGVCVGSMDTSGALGGGQIGYNWNLGGVILGVEADLAFTNIEGDSFFGGKNQASELDWMATVRGRAGMLIRDNMLVYGTAGVVWGGWDDSATPIVVPHRWSTVYTGYTVGGGIESIITRNVSVKLEYLFVDFGDATHKWTDSGLSGTATFDHEVHTVRLGVNFKLN